MSVLLLALTGHLSCTGESGPAGGASPGEVEIVPAYNRETGRLEALLSDRDGDGRVDTWAYMDGRRLDRIELDRNGDGTPDRIEYYDTPEGAGGARFDAAVITRAEELGAEGSVTRREFYEEGSLRRVEEDVNLDGRIDKWEDHKDGRLLRMALDLQGRGFPDRRLIYAADGVSVEVDPDGDGHFEPASGADPGQKGKRP